MDKKTNVYVLGVHDGHNCGATLLKDGKIVASLCEERLSRVKNDVGYPSQAVAAVLSLGGIGPERINRVAIASLFMHAKSHLTDIGSWYRVGREDQELTKIRENKEYQKHIFKIRRAERIKDVVDHLGIGEDRITFTEHHASHAAAAFYGSPWDLREKILVLTCDGSGDGICASVSVSEGRFLKRLATTDRRASIGKIYSRVTYLMGMRPWEHEYKIMGLAPYANPELSARARKVFDGLMGLSADGMGFSIKSDLETNYCYEFLRERLENHRFDGIAGGLQEFTENLLTRWVSSCVRKTGVSKVACGGGVFMNVKANMLIDALPEVESLYVFPSASDESLSIGAAWHVYYNDLERSADKNGGFGNIYLGDEFGEEDMTRALNDAGAFGRCEVKRESDIDKTVALLLAKGRIVARLTGRMEWGARALGNRSILAHPADASNAQKINSMIKMRDFWMPFAPSILKECAEEYLSNPKNLFSPHMTLCYKTTVKAQRELVAALHPFDKTARAQIVDQADNPAFHRLLTEFRRETGVGGLLNTSFNLHGYPLVRSPADALQVFFHSGLDCLALGPYLLEKK